MIYLKKFESHTGMIPGLPTRGFSIDISTVIIGPSSGDSVNALYINNELHTYGDYSYFGAYLDGFVDGLKWAGANISYKRYICDDPEWVGKICDRADPPPKNIEDLINIDINEELLGIRRSIRGLTHKNEINVEEVKYHLLKGHYEYINFSKKRGLKNEEIKSYKFEINYRGENFSVKIEEHNYLPDIRFKFNGTTDYHVYIDNKLCHCSRKISKEIYNLVKSLKSKPRDNN